MFDCQREDLPFEIDDWADIFDGLLLTPSKSGGQILRIQLRDNRVIEKAAVGAAVQRLHVGAQDNPTSHRHTYPPDKSR